MRLSQAPQCVNHLSCRVSPSSKTWICVHIMGVALEGQKDAARGHFEVAETVGSS